MRELLSLKNIHQFETAAQERMKKDAFNYIKGAADDTRTLQANISAFQHIRLRPRRLVDVSKIDTRVELFGTTYKSPIIISPVGFQQFFHEEGEVGTAKAAAKLGHLMMVSSLANSSVKEIASKAEADLWYQLYTTPNRNITKKLLENAEQAGCAAVALTVDTPIWGNREAHDTTLEDLLNEGTLKMGNYEGLLNGETTNDPSLTWDIVTWLKDNTKMKVILKGIVTHEDAKLAVEYGADGVIVSNHGGRQLESDRATIDCLEEVVDAVAGKMPVLIDGGFRRGTDILKALAIGATAVCIGRPIVWGLGAFGQAGVERVLELLQTELVRDMQLLGTPTLADLNRNFIKMT